MSDLIDELVERYGRLEMAIQKRMNASCAPFCTVCQSPCCRIDFCYESLESPFLEAVRSRFAPGAAWCATSGWLTPSGCMLTAGRPPVCYEFLCGAILTAQDAGEQLAALKQLAMLITIAGRRARGSRHLVALSDLSRTNTPRLLTQVARSQIALQKLFEH